MTKSPLMTLEQLAVRLDAQSLEMAALRAALDVQFKRIAQMQAELDLLPLARTRRSLLMAGLPSATPRRPRGAERVASQNGNGRSHR